MLSGKLLREVEPDLMDTLINATKQGDHTTLQALISSAKDVADDVGDRNDDDTETESEDEVEVSVNLYLNISTKLIYMIRQDNCFLDLIVRFLQ